MGSAPKLPGFNDAVDGNVNPALRRPQELFDGTSNPDKSLVEHFEGKGGEQTCGRKDLKHHMGRGRRWDSAGVAAGCSSSPPEEEQGL